MAAMQAGRSSRRVNEKHIGLLNEMKQESGAKGNGFLAGAGGNNGQQLMGNNFLLAAAPGGNIAQAAQATTRASMYNNGVDKVTFLEKKDWSGKMLGHYAHSIDADRTGSFTHRGVPPKDINGSKGAIVYVGPNVRGSGQNNCAWVLAWSVPGDGSGNKVYVETGPAGRYPSGSIDWDAIKTNLESASYESHYYDDTSKTEISADIVPNGNTPILAAVFDVSL